MNPEFAHQYTVLYRKALADLHLARLAIASNDDCIDDATILFHLQQVAEKCLKALLAFNKVHFEKIHDLTILIGLCKKHSIAIPEYTATFSQLNPFAVIGRYGIIKRGDVDIAKWLQTLESFTAFTEEIIS